VASVPTPGSLRATRAANDNIRDIGAFWGRHRRVLHGHDSWVWPPCLNRQLGRPDTEACEAGVVVFHHGIDPIANDLFP